LCGSEYSPAVRYCEGGDGASRFWESEEGQSSVAFAGNYTTAVACTCEIEVLTADVAEGSILLGRDNVSLSEM